MDQVASSRVSGFARDVVHVIHKAAWHELVEASLQDHSEKLGPQDPQGCGGKKVGTLKTPLRKSRNPLKRLLTKDSNP